MSGTWLWIDIPLCVLFFLAVSGIPMWMAFKHPDTGPDSGGNGLGSQHNGLARRQARSPQPVPVNVPAGRNDRNYRDGRVPVMTR